MIAIQKSFNVEEAVVIPGDLRQWFDSLAIVGFVLQAQAFTDSRNLDTNLPEQTIVSGQANALLAVLAYCYACDMPSSQELERSSETDPIIRYLCSNRLPEVSTIRRFRRHNREQLEKCLMNVFRLAWQARLERMCMLAYTSRFTPLQESRCSVDSANNYRESGLIDFFEGEAQSRVLNAIKRDSMEMDV